MKALLTKNSLKILEIKLIKDW